MSVVFQIGKAPAAHRKNKSTDLRYPFKSGLFVKTTSRFFIGSLRVFYRVLDPVGYYFNRLGLIIDVTVPMACAAGIARWI